MSRNRLPNRAFARAVPAIEQLEDRVSPAVQPLTLADPSLVGATPGGTSFAPSLSADGQVVAFASDADDLAANDTDHGRDVFVFNRATGATSLVSVGLNGQAAGGTCLYSAPVVSPDGRYVAFEASGDGTYLPGVFGRQVFLRDLRTDTTSLVSLAANGAAAAGDSVAPLFTADSQHLVFASTARNLIPGGSGFGDTDNLFEYNLATRTNTLVTTNEAGGPANNIAVPSFSSPFSASANGRYVVFVSRQGDLVANDANNRDDVFVRDVVAGTTTLVSVNKLGTSSGNDHSRLASISADGRYVAFESRANDLTDDPVPLGRVSVYIRDLVAGTTVSVSAAGTASLEQVPPVLSADGRYVAFASQIDLVPQDTNGHNDVYVRDQQTGALTLASVNAAGSNGGNIDSALDLFTPGSTYHRLAFTPDGRHLVFESGATDLVNGTSPYINLFERDLVAGTTRLVSAGSNNHSFTALVSADGRFVAFLSQATNLVAGQANPSQNVFLRDLTAGVTQLASRVSPLLPEAYPAGGGLGAASPDGRFVAIVAGPSNDLAPGVTFTGFQTPDVYLRDRQTGALSVIDLGTDGHSAAGGFSPALTPDGRFVAFASRVPDGATAPLVTGVTYLGGFFGSDVYLRDRQSNTTKIVSVDPAGTHSDNGGFGPGHEVALSDDGRFVAFTSHATNLVSGVSNPNGNNAVYLRDTQADTTTLVSHDLANDGALNGSSYDISLSGDGRYVTFVSTDPDLTANDSNNQVDVFRWDRATGQVTLVSVSSAGGPGNNASGDVGGHEAYPPRMTPDGRFVVFSSTATDLVGNSTNGRTNVYVRDMTNNVTTLVSAAASGGGDNDSYDGVITPDGHAVAFTSLATNLTGAATGGLPNVYVRDLLANTTTLASVTPNGSGGNGSSNTPTISDDGRFVVFNSQAGDLVSAFVRGNTGSDLFVRDLANHTTAAVTLNASGTASGNADSSGRALLSGDGRTVFFASAASDLIAGDRDYTTDVFAYSNVGTASIGGRVFLGIGGAGLANWTVFLDANGNGQLDDWEVSALTDGSGRYTFTGLAPGSYTVAVVAQAGFQQTGPAGGTYGVTIGTDDTAVGGKDFGEVKPLPDLTVSMLTLPSAGSPGQPVTVTWQDRNVGAAAASGWQDALYLSPTPTLGPDARLLDLVSHPSSLAAGATFSGSDTVNLPPLPAGSYYLIVQADWRNQLPDANRVNNVALSGGTLAVSFPTLTLGTPVNGQFAAAGQDQYYQLTVAAGQSLLVTLSGAPASSRNDLYVRKGTLPTPDGFDYAARVAGQADQTLTVPAPQAGTYYVLVHNRAAAGAVPFTLTAAAPGYAVQSLDVASGGNTGRVTIGIHGTDLTPGTQVRLAAGSVTLTAATVDYRDASLLYATFDLTGQPANTYDVQLSDGALSTTLPRSFMVISGVSSPLQIYLTVPNVSRYGALATAVVSYVNAGNVDMPAPLLSLTADKATLELDGEDHFFGNAVQFLGVSTSGSAGVLRAGTAGAVSLHYLSTTTNNLDDIHFQVTVADDSKPIDWAGQKAALRPAYIPADAWDAVFANLVANLGGTVASYHAALAADASYLSQLGQTTDDVSRLFGFEIEKADAAYTARTLASHLDASLPGHGLALTFERRFLQPITGRYHLGTLGRGWVSNWDVRASTDAQGDVTLDESGGLRFFTKRADGTYTPGQGDHAVLTRVNGAYQLREVGGTVLAFNADGTLSYIQDANGNRITAAYANGLLTRLTHSDGSSLTLTYTNGLLTRVADSAGRVSTYGYDSDQHLINYSGQYGTETYGYVTGAPAAGNNALASVAYSDNTHVFFGYDSEGRLDDYHRDNNQEDYTFAYSAAGGYTVTDANNQSTTLLPDDFGQISRVIDPLGRVLQASYDSAMNLTRLVGPLGTQYSLTYDEKGNVTSTTDPLGLTVHYTYDADGHLLSYQDARGNTTAYRYDGSGDLLGITYPDGNVQQYQYDPLGDVTQFTNARGRAVGYLYFPNGQLKEKDFAGGTKQTYTYDSHGNLRTATDASGTITFSYNDPNNADLVTGIAYPDGHSLAFTYNSVGQRTSGVDDTGFMINYRYDAVGRLGALLDGGGNLIDQYTYDSAGQLIQQDMGNGTRTTYQYDGAGQLLHLVNLASDHVTVNSRFDYTYDALGRVRTMTTDGVKTTYGYDADGQLTSITLPGRAITYVYDAAGNRVSVTDNGVTTAYSANRVNEYTAVGGATYTYDADGNLISKTDAGGTTTYTYDDENRLIGVNAPGLSSTFTYDPLGNRNSETVNGQTTHDLIDPFGLGDVVAEYDGSGNLLAHYTQGLGLVSRVAAGGAAAYYDFDLTGNTAGLTNTAGAYVNRYTYLPFGETTTQASALPNPFTFAGQFGVMSVGGGLFDMRARAYSPATGQFLSDDPTGLAGGDTNLRRYVANEPMTQVDPSGLAPQYNYRGGDPALDHRIRTLMDPNSNDTLGGNRGVNNGGTDQSTTQNTKHPDTVQERDEQLQGQEEKKGNDTGTTNKSEILPPPSDPEGPSDPEEPCFPPDTLVATEAGLRPIAGVESGERVWAYDFVVGDWRLSEVERRHDGNYNGAFVTIDFGQGELTATAYHPFWVLEGEGLEERPAPLEVPVSEDRGRSLPGRWVNSHDLREGDVLFLRAKEPAAVRRVRLHPHPTQTCNLCVKGLHNYAVGEGQVLVHNVIGPKPVALPRFPALPRLQALLLPQITIKLGPSGKSFGELSIDPNYLLGPAGVGPQQAVLPEQVLPYTIGFENDPAHASLAAQDVVITETLDANLDWPTFQFGDLGFGPTTVHVAGNQSFHATVDATNVA